MKRTVPMIAAGISLLLAGGYTLLCALPDTERMLPRTTINDVPLGGMTLEEATETLEENEQRYRKNASLTVAFEGKSYQIPLGDALGSDPRAAAERALQKSQKRFSARGLALLKAVLLGDHSTSLSTVRDTKALQRSIAGSGLLDADSTTQTSYKTGDGQLLFTVGTAGQAVDEEALTEEIIAAVQADDFENVIACPDTLGKVNAVDLDRVYDEIHTDPANATLDPENGYGIVEGVPGVGFDKESARLALEAAEEGSTVAVDLVYTEPEISAQDLKDRLFADKLSTFTTQVGGTSNRLTNIALATEKCNGSILVSGGVFSFNNTVGEQTEATGFKLDNAILDGQIVQAYGGGICQVSSTIFAAALFADLKIVERWNHDYVSSYIPAGVDAAVAWGFYDLQIANDKSYPIRIDVSFTNGDLTVDIWGTKTEEAPVEIETRTIDNPSPGTLAVETYRRVSHADGSQIDMEKVADSLYIAQ